VDDVDDDKRVVEGPERIKLTNRVAQQTGHAKCVKLLVFGFWIRPYITPKESLSLAIHENK
jgi:hypothetical protein